MGVSAQLTLPVAGMPYCVGMSLQIAADLLQETRAILSHAIGIDALLVHNDLLPYFNEREHIRKERRKHEDDQEAFAEETNGTFLGGGALNSTVTKLDGANVGNALQKFPAALDPFPSFA